MKISKENENVRLLNNIDGLVIFTRRWFSNYQIILSNFVGQLCWPWMDALCILCSVIRSIISGTKTFEWGQFNWIISVQSIIWVRVFLFVNWMLGFSYFFSLFFYCWFFRSISLVPRKLRTTGLQSRWLVELYVFL